MGKTIRLTMAQAVAHFLKAQMTVVDGRKVPIFAGVWAIFGHGNVAGMGEALYQVREELPTLRAHNEQGMAHAAIAFAKASRRRRAMACTTSIGPGATNMVTAAALASENKSLAHPASVDSLPTSANQEDHVSMATFAGRRLDDMAHNTAVIVGIELLAAAQGIDFHRPLKTSPHLEHVHHQLRQKVPFFDADRFFAPDIEAAKQMVLRGELSTTCKNLFAPLYA